MKSKFLTLILCVLMLLSFAGCGSSDAGAGATTPTSEVGATPTIESVLQTPTSNGSEDFYPLEIKTYGYSISKGQYLYCAVIVHNPNTAYCVQFPSFRITAKDADGFLLGSEEQVLSIIYPQQDFCYAGLAFKVEEVPTTVDVEMLTPDDYNIFDVSLLDYPEYEPLTVNNAIMRNNRVMGEINNNNNYDIDSAIVTVVFMDENGAIVSGNSTFVNAVSSFSSTPFEISVSEDLSLDNFEVYANIW